MAILSKIKILVQHQGFRRYAVNTSWMMIEQILRIIAGLLVGIWVARYLGPEQFGLFSYVLAFTAIFSGVAKLGLDGIVVRELINHPGNRDTCLGTAFWLKIIGAFLVMCIIAVTVPFTSNNPTINLFVLIITAGLVFQSFEVVEFYFQSQALAKIVSICKIIQLTLSSVIKIYLVVTKAELIWFVLVAAFDAFSLAVSYAIAYKLCIKKTFYKKFDSRIALQLLKDSWPLIFSAIVVSIYMRIDQVMIQEMLGEYEVGIYSAAVRLSEAVYFIPTIFTAALFPAILHAKKQSEELYKKRLQRLYSLMVWMAIAIAFPVTLLSDWLVVSLFGQDYEKAGVILTIHIWAAVFVFLGAAGAFYTIENITKIYFFKVFIGAVLNIMLNYLLIPYGVEWAALSTLFSQFISNYVLDLFFSEARSQFILKSNAFLGGIK